MGRGEERTGGRRQASNLSGALEALIGAIYFDRDIRPVKKFILDIFKQDLIDISNDKRQADYKSLYQEYCLKKFCQIPQYELISQDGPEHKKQFVVSVKVTGHVRGTGWGLNKKSAQQMAAKEALEKA